MTKPGVADPKVREPQRLQPSFRVEVLDEPVSDDHPARLLWNVLGEYHARSEFRAAHGAASDARCTDVLSRAQDELHLEAVLAQGDDPELSKAQKARRVAAAKD